MNPCSMGSIYEWNIFEVYFNIFVKTYKDFFWKTSIGDKCIYAQQLPKVNYDKEIDIDTDFHKGV